MAEEAWAHARSGEMTLHRTVGGGAGPHEFENLLHLDDVAFHAGDLGDRGDLALAIRLTLELHDELHGARDLAADRGNGHGEAGHTDHLLEARDRVARRVGVDGR